MEHCLQSKQLRAAVRVLGMCIHYALRHLHQLTGMADKQQGFKAAVNGIIQKLTHKVAAGNMTVKIKLHFIAGKILAVVAEEHQQIFIAACLLRSDFHIHRFNQRLFTHRLHNAAGS